MMSSRCDVTLLAVVLCVMKDLHVAVANTVYFNSYGQCLKAVEGKAFSLHQGAYTALATGAAEIHETLICIMTFQSPEDTGICLTFKEFKVNECGVTLQLYQGQSASGKEWKELTCEDRNPPQMCTSEQFVTMRLKKARLNQNRGYEFEISVEKSTSLQGEDVIVVSFIGLFVGIIAGIIGIIVIIAAIVLCCCYKPCKPAPGGKNGGGEPQDAPLTPSVLQPTAPPALELEDEHTPLQSEHGVPLTHPYPGNTESSSEQPPPYAPPAYEDHDFAEKV